MVTDAFVGLARDGSKALKGRIQDERCAQRIKMWLHRLSFGEDESASKDVASKKIEEPISKQLLRDASDRRGPITPALCEQRARSRPVTKYSAIWLEPTRSAVGVAILPVVLLSTLYLLHAWVLRWCWSQVSIGLEGPCPPPV